MRRLMMLAILLAVLAGPSVPAASSQALTSCDRVAAVLRQKQGRTYHLLRAVHQRVCPVTSPDGSPPHRRGA